MDDFVNRHNERHLLLDLLQSFHRQNRTVIIVGDTGVGKSELTNYTLTKYAINELFFKVEIKYSINNKYEDGVYLREVAKHIHTKSNQYNIESFADYIKQMTSKTFKEQIFSSIREDIIDKMLFGKRIIKEYSDMFFNEGTYNINSILNSYNAEQYSLMKEYIDYIFRKYNLILNIENIQNIDKNSFIDIVTACQKSKGSLLLLEYTPKENVIYSLSDLTNYFEHIGIPVNVINVKPLSLDDVKLIINKQPKASWELIKNSFINWNGNLKPVIDLLTRIKYDEHYLENNKIEKVNNYSEESISKLASHSILLLIIIAEHIDPIEYSIFQEFINDSNELFHYINISSELLILEKFGYLKKDRLNRYVISHDSIISVLQNNKHFLKLRILAKRLWYNIYQNENIITFVSKSVRLSKLLYFASQLNLDNVIVSYLNDIYTEALKAKYPESIIEYVLIVRQKLIKKTSSRDKIDAWLISLYYNLAYSEKAYEIIKDTSNHNSLITLITILVLEDIGKKEEALSLCELELKLNNHQNLNYELALRSTRLMINYVIGNYDIALQEYSELYNNPKYCDLFEYGFVLRNAELIYSETSFRDSLIPIWESVKHFHKYKAFKMEAYSRITYGVQSALIGRFSIALRQFKIAGNLLQDIVIERHSILNNISVVNLYQGNYNNEIKENINRAISLSQRDFDKTALYMNYLALLDWREENEEAKSVISILLTRLNQRTFSSVELTAGCYYNISKFYEKIGDTNNAHRYIKLIYELPLTINNIWSYRLYNKPIQHNDNDYIESTVNRCLSFISNWNLEVDSSLMQY